MKKIKLNIVGIFSNHAQEANFTLLLGEINGYRKIPIMIGVTEAQSIALALEGGVLERPIMHDLFKELTVQLNYMVKEIIITSLKDEVFFAQIFITNEKELIILDARPSDAIAIGIRFNAPLFINEALLNQMGDILIPKSERTDPKAGLINLDIRAQIDKNVINNLENYSVQVLKELLELVVNREDYKQAALIRDELKRRDTIGNCTL